MLSHNLSVNQIPMLRTLQIFIFSIFIYSAVNAQNAGNWQLTGPVAFPVNVSGQINGIGRVCQIKFHPTIDSVVYAVSASGGLFISRDHGANWNATGTDQLPRTACSSVCIDYSNDSIIYLSTGDPNYYGTDYGIYKSTDGGQSWNPSNTTIGNRMALEMLMDPSNPLIIIAATNDGIFKTYDGGQNWTVKKSGGAFTDMTYKAVAGSDTMFAVTTNGFWLSADNGETWNQVAVPVPVGNTADGIRIGVSALNPERIYLGVLNYTATNHWGTIYRSDDGGATFTGIKTQAFPDIAGYDPNDPGQGNYNWTLTVDPLNPDVVYTGSHCVWKSVDAGVNWTLLTNWYEIVHTDMHQFIFNPYDPSELWQANDGGVWVSNDGGTSWSTRSDGLAATENYSAAQSNLLRQMASIGTQDNGELYFLNGGWFTNRGGDWGSRMKFDYLNPQTTYYYENGTRRALSGSETSLNLPFTPTNQSEFAFTPLNPQLAYVAYNQVYRSDAVGINPVTWTQISNINLQIKALTIASHREDQIYAVTSNTKVYRCDNALDVSPTFQVFNAPAATNTRANITTIAGDTNVVYLSCGSKVYRSADRGQTWSNVTYNLPSVNIIGMYHDSSTASESIYICTAKAVWYKNDTMVTWMNYSQGLPTVADITSFMMYNSNSAASLLRVAYYGRGVWESDLFGASAALPEPLFSADTTYGCPGFTVQFTDESVGSPTSWQWSFPGGTPSVSTLQNPVVVYNTGGVHDVTLTVSNVNGSKTYTRSSYITVFGSTAMPLQEGFETVAFPPAGWIRYSASNDGFWQQSNGVGGYGNSLRSASFDNYNVDLTGKSYELHSMAYDLSATDSALLVFDVAYSMYSAAYSDTLFVKATTDCGLSWTLIYAKGGSQLATAPNNTSSGFVPTASQWRTDSVWLPQFSGQNQVQLSFINKAAYGQILYVDNINLFDPSTVGMQTVNETTGNLTVFPNPARGTALLKFTGEQVKAGVVLLLDARGRLIRNFGSFGERDKEKTLELEGLSPGIYTVVVQSGKVKKQARLTKF